MLLDAVEGWSVVGEAGDGMELVSIVERDQPDLVVVDLGMPTLGGVEAIARLRKLRSELAIVVLSAREDDYSVTAAVDAGARAYVTKTSGPNELEFAIRAVLKGQRYISPSVCGAFLEGKTKNGANASPVAQLSDREREIMKLLSEGHPNREISKLLHISPRTVDSHRANILRKLGIGTNAELVQLALKYGVIE